MVMTSNRGFGEWAEIFGDAMVATALPVAASVVSLAVNTASPASQPSAVTRGGSAGTW